jgi:hypothetical protein
MAVRAPLYLDSGNLKEMDAGQVDEIVDRAVYQYSISPSVELSVANSGGNLGIISDTRLQAGDSITRTDRFANEGETDEPSTVTVNYNRIIQAASNPSTTTDSGKTWPIYRDNNGNIHAMSLTDVKDTFLHPAIDLLTLGTLTTKQGGTYHINSASNVSGSTLVSGTPVFVDTRADTAQYTAGGIGETLDQPTTITNYYLHRVDGTNSGYTNPMYITAGDDLQEYTDAGFDVLLQQWVKSVAAVSSEGYKLTYNIGGAGQSRGSGMADTKLNGTGNYQTLYVNTDDYRAQEFPNGSPTTENTYFLNINKS